MLDQMPPDTTDRQYSRNEDEASQSTKPFKEPISFDDLQLMRWEDDGGALPFNDDE